MAAPLALPPAVLVVLSAYHFERNEELLFRSSYVTARPGLALGEMWLQLFEVVDLRSRTRRWTVSGHERHGRARVLG